MTVQQTDISQSSQQVDENGKVATEYQPRELFRWTHEQYEQLLSEGIISANDDTELIFGYIVKKETINPPHAGTIRKLNKYFLKRFANDEYELFYELPIKLPNSSQPKPDYVIAVFQDDEYEGRHPTAADVLVVFEVSDTSLKDDQTTKLEMYARAGIKEYWIVNIPGQQIEIHLEPDVEAGTYQPAKNYKRGESLSSPLLGEVAVDDLMVNVII